MTIEWIQNATLIDFPARILTSRLLAKFIVLSNNVARSELVQRFMSVAEYFQQLSLVSIATIEPTIG